GTWSTAGSWAPAGVPDPNDDVVLPGSSGGYVLTLDVSTNALDSLTIGNGASLGPINLVVGSNTLNVNGVGGGATNTITMNEPGGGFIVLGGGTINATSLGLVGATQIVSGAGTLAIGTVTGSGGLVASGGVLAVNGTVDAGINLSIDTAPGST